MRDVSSVSTRPRISLHIMYIDNLLRYMTYITALRHPLHRFYGSVTRCPSSSSSSPHLIRLVLFPPEGASYGKRGRECSLDRD